MPRANLKHRAAWHALYTLVPLALGLCAAALVWFYPLDQRTHGRIVRAIGRQKQQRSRHFA